MENKPSPIKKRKTPWLLGGLVFTLLTVLVLLQSSNLWKSFSVETASDTILLYALSSLNFFAFVIFAFIFIRSLLKLRRERRALQLGSKIKSRLLLYFIAISLLPIIAMAVFSYLFMNRALERWFASIPDNVIRETRQMQEQAVTDQTLKLRQTAQMLGSLLENQPADNRKLQKLVEAGNLTCMQILASDGEILAESTKNLSLEQKAELDKTLQIVYENRFDDANLSDGKGFDIAMTRFADGKKLVVVSDLRPNENVSQVVENSLAEFDKLKQKQVTIRQMGLLTLGVLTFLLIFASSWTAFYIAKGLTVPIRALAEGADKIARGDLAHRVDVLAEDELALLVSAFNQMTDKLEKNSAELGERRKYIETILQSLSTGVISFDGKNRITTINQAAMQIFNLESADFTQFALDKVVSEENRLVLERLLARAKRIGQASEQTALQREQTDGASNSINESLPVALTATALPKTVDNEIGVVLVIEDLSELITAQRASAWQEVARRMAHEIKNPLTPIQLSAERIAKRFAQVQNPKSKVQSPAQTNLGILILDFGLTTKVIDESTETILREVNSLKSMVDEFSQFARLPNVKLESGQLNEVIEQSVALYEDRASNVQINLRLAANLPKAMIDNEQIRRVLVNLLENAFEAFDESQTEKQIFIKTFHYAARDLIVAEVSDNGNGIAPADLNKLFQPYFSTKGRGTGLGLAIVQRIISEHHGKIKAVANKPNGAKFIIEIPFSA
ncbi:MAG: ATP-binding protein [Acidobacteriota bacterium]